MLLDVAVYMRAVSVDVVGEGQKFAVVRSPQVTIAEADTRTA